LRLLLQNLMNAALHGSGQALVANIRRVLGELHRSKRLGGAGSVDAMLVRLYEPILFRALSATNAGVRRNALQLLLDAFPLLVSVGRGGLEASHLSLLPAVVT
jgi:condensin-2 complex subunit G2